MANTVYSASLVMTADVNQAKQQLQSLQQSLDHLMRNAHTTNNDLGLTKSINSAITQVGNLKIALDQAVNVNTGKLNLTKFASSLKETGTDIQQIATSLSSLGVRGQQAFTQLTNSILNAEIPLKRTNALLNNFKQTFSNTIKWGISSAVFNKMVGGLQSAYGYAQDLDKSLNNIRIVTGYSSNEMAKFAKQANEAAKALKTTTTSYTDASLIYYQQGLDSKAVKERTDATIKMANVTGESAKAVSDYMTAIWNNFDNGSKSLEYYADVMTALGAATASSTDEIAAGLEKFAAVSETVGLSYEYATAALATVTAETRQSADVVGNAFKTLFSRIQGLNLGETQDDGTTLNKYSQALEKVGINIKDTNGQIKQMDVILEELGAKWQSLGNDTQIALAQSVAGVRQYTQLIALMDNWDTFKINLEVAGDAEGTLTKQQAIYEESWEAATKKVRTSFEHLWDAVIDEEALKDLTRGFAEVVDQIGNVIDTMGGMKGVISAISFLITKSLTKNTELFGASIRQAAQSAEQLRTRTMQAFKSMSTSGAATDIQKDTYGQMYNFQERIIQKTKDLLAVNYQLTDEQKKQISLQNDRVQQLGNDVIGAEQELIARQTSNQNAISRTATITSLRSGGKLEAANVEKDLQGLFTKNLNFGFVESQVSRLQAQLTTLGGTPKGLTEFNKTIQSSYAEIKGLGVTSKELDKQLEVLGPESNLEDFQAALKELIALMERLRNEATMTEAEMESNYGQGVAVDIATRGHQQGQQKSDLAKAQQDFKTGAEGAEEALDRLQAKAPTVAQSFMAIGNAISSVTMVLSSLKGLRDTWENEDMDFSEKMLSTFTTLGMVIPMVASSFGAFNIQQMSTISNSIRAAAGLSSVGVSGTAAGAGLTAAGTGAQAASAGLWSILGPIALVAAAFAGLIIIIAKITDKIQEQEAAFKTSMENIQESATQLKNIYDETKQSYQSLLDTINNYENSKNSLKDLKVGTEEWKEVINKTNEEARRLIDTYNILTGYSYNPTTGMIEFKEGVFDNAKVDMQNRLNADYQNYMISDTAAKQAALDNKVNELVKKDEYLSDTALYWDTVMASTTATMTAGALYGASTVGALGTAAAPGAGTLAGGGVGALGGGLIGALIGFFGGLGLGSAAVNMRNEQNQKQKDKMSLFFDKYLETGNYEGAKKSVFGTQEAFDDFFKELKTSEEEIQILLEDAYATFKENRLNYQETINSEFDKYASYSESTNKEALNGLLANNLSEIIEDTYASQDVESAKLLYATKHGYEIKSSENGKTTYWDNKNQKEFVIDDKTLQYYAAQIEALNGLSTQIAVLDGHLSQLNSPDGEALKGYLSTGHFGNNNLQEIYSLQEQDTGSGYIEYLRNSFKGVTDDQIAQYFGKETIGEVSQAIQAQVKITLNSLEDSLRENMYYEIGGEIPTSLLRSGNEYWGGTRGLESAADFIQKMDLDSAQSLKDSYDAIAFGPMGQEAGGEFMDAFAKIVKNKDQEFIDAFAKIDFSKVGAIDEAKALMEEYGYSVSNCADEFEILSSMAYQLDFSKFTTLKEDLEAIAGIISDLELGAILSEEDYQLLSKYVDELEQYFMLTSQGRKFIGSDEVAGAIGKEAYNASIEELKKQQTGQKEFEGYGHDDDSGNRILVDWNSWALNADTQTTYEKESYKENQRKTLDNILANESAETLGLIGEGYEDWKDIDTSTLTSEQIAQFFGQLAEFTSDKIDEQDFQENDQKFIGDSQNINEFDQNVEMVGGYEKAGLTEEQYQNQKQYFQDLANEQAKAAQSYQELNQLLLDGEINQEAYQKGLVEQAKQYPALSKEVEAYEEALADANGDTSKCTEEWNELNKAFKSNQIGKAAKDLKESKKTMEDLTTALGEGAKVNEDYIAASQDMADSLSEIFGVKVDPTFVQENIEDIFDYIETGSGDILQKLNQKAIIAASPDLEGMLSNMTGGIDGFITKINELNGMSFNITGTGDFSTLQAEIGGVKMTAQDLGNFLNSLANSGMLFELENMEMFQALLEAIQNEDLAALQEAVTALKGEGMTLKSNDNAYPADTSEELASGGYTGGGGGGGSDKVDRDKLTDALSDTYKKKRDRLKAQYEGLDPESASKYIKEEIALLEEEQKILEEQIKTWKGLLKTKVQEFNQEYADELGFDLTLNDDGEIANLSEIYQKLIQMYDEGNTDLADKIYKKLQESAGIQASIDEAVQGMMDKEREQAELELKDITDRIDWRIKQIDYQIKRLNYYQEKLLIQAHGNKQTIEAMLEGFQYQEQEMLKLFEKGDALRQGIAELNAAKAKYPNHQQMFNEAILDYQSDLIDVNKDILELRADMEELVKEVLELALDEIDIQNERINKYVSMLDRFQNIIDLSGRSILDQALKVEIGTTKLDTLINKMSISKQTMEGLAKATAEAQAALERRAADGDETSVSMWENQVEELERELEAAQDDFLANWEEVLQAAADIFDMRVELTVQTLEAALSPFSNLSILEDRYTKDKEIQDQYLDDATKLYELNKLNRQLNMSIQDENDLLAKSKLRDIQQEILAYQKAGVDMSQYDLDILQKKYDLRLAEIALLEAQNSKTSMRLIRDAAGNWTYAYDSDQNAIEEAIQRVEDATYDLQKATTQYIDEMSEELISIQQDFAAAIGEVDRNASDYQEQLLYLQQHYMTKYMQTLGEFRKATEEAGISIHDTQYGMMMDLYNFEDAQNKFKLNSDTAINDLIINYKDWQKVVEQTMNVAGTSWESFGDDTGATLDSLQEHISALCDEISKLVDVLMQYVSTAIGMVEEWQAKYSKQVDAELAKNEAVINDDSLHQSRSGGGGGADYLAMANGDYSLAMTLLIADQGQAGLNSKEFQALAEGRDKRIEGDDKLQAQLGKQIITTENLINVLTDSTKSETALGSDVVASAAGMTGGVKINYTQNNYQLSQDDKYTSQQNQLLLDFINGKGAGTNTLSSFVSSYVPSPNYGSSRDYNYYNGTYDPKSGWCARWVGDVMAYNGADFVRGNAWDAVKSNGGTAYNGQYISNGTAVGSPSGEYGHIGIYQDGYIYATSYSGNSLDRYTIDEWTKNYGKLYVTNAGNAQVGQTAANVFNRENGNTYGNGALLDFVYGYGLDNNINLSSNRNSLLGWIDSYDTGGYTGKWGSEGRLAMLHEKELVLNKQDTPNILSAVKIARSIDDTISNLTSNTDWKLRNLLGFTDPVFDKQPIEQTVQISAEFPGVTDQYEIQEALSNLSNDASQYLSIKSNLF